MRGRNWASSTVVWWSVVSVSVFSSLGWQSRAIAQIRPVQTVSPETTAQPITPIAPDAIATEMVFVNPSLGQNRHDGLSWQTPLQTITHALQVSAPGSVIMLAPGTYSAETGEQFPIVLDQQITIQGDPGSYGQSIVIQGAGEISTEIGDRTSVAMVIQDEATLVGVSVVNPRNGHSVWIETGQPLIMNNTVWPAQSIYVTRRSTPTLHQNQTQAVPTQSNPITAQIPEIPTAETAAFPTPSSLSAVQSDDVNSDSEAMDSPEPTESASAFNWDEQIAAMDPPTSTLLRSAFSVRSDQVGYQLPDRPEDATSSMAPRPEPSAPIEAIASIELDEPAIALESATLAAGEQPDIAISPDLLSMMERQVPIDIPVSAPPGGWPANVSQVPSLPFASYDVLPVPSIEIPVGNTGSLPMVPVSGGTTLRTGLPLRYRVIVEAGQAELRSHIESLVPGAFQTFMDGQTVMQAGAFSDLTNAQELVDRLNDFGFRAIVEPMN